MSYFSFKNRTIAQKGSIGAAIFIAVFAILNQSDLFGNLVLSFILLWAGTGSNDEDEKESKKDVYDDILDYDEEKK